MTLGKESGLRTLGEFVWEDGIKVALNSAAFCTDQHKGCLIHMLYANQILISVTQVMARLFFESDKGYWRKQKGIAHG